MTLKMELQKELKMKLQCEVLNYQNKEDVEEAAICLAETFAGVQVGEAFISEPMTRASKLSRDHFVDFTKAYLEAISPQGLTIIAKDEKGKIVGVIANEDFNPEEEVPEFSGYLEPMNHIIEFLLDLDIKFADKFKSVFNREITKGEFVHNFMIGVRLEKNKKFVALKLFEVLEKIAKEKGYKGIFAEATSKRSQKLFIDYMNYYIPTDLSGEKIVKRYDEDFVFKSIPHDVAEYCALVYKNFDEEYKI